MQREERTLERRGRAPAPSRGGAAPVWLVAVLALAGLSWVISSLESDVSAAGFTRLDTARVELSLPAGKLGIPSDWSNLVAARVARLGPLSTRDEDLIEVVTLELEALPFVREVGRAQVIWPDGLTLAVRIREPVGCICVGEEYLPVAADGMVLPGYWPDPPDFGRGMLPVIGPVNKSLIHTRPGDRLVEALHIDALSVAVSMREYLTRGDLDLLGPVVIDATEAESAAVNEPGTRLYLEGSREIFFGRPPSFHAAGELPEPMKWAHLMEAVALLYLPKDGPPGEIRDWDLLDVRWDVATLRPRIGYR